jgi:hypothetical protein
MHCIGVKETRSQVALTFEVTRATNVSLRVLDPMGRLVGTIVDGHLTPGIQRFVLNRRRPGDVQLGTGMYILRAEMQSDGGRSTREMKLFLEG